MDVWEVLQQRTAGDDLVAVGSVNAPDLELALLLAHETHFRHKEGVGFAVRRRGDDEVHVYDGEVPLGGVSDHSYRRQEGYVGVGAKLKRVRDEMQARGLMIEGVRPPASGGDGRGREGSDGH